MICTFRCPCAVVRHLDRICAYLCGRIAREGNDAVHALHRDFVLLDVACFVAVNAGDIEDLDHVPFGQHERRIVREFDLEVDRIAVVVRIRLRREVEVGVGADDRDGHLVGVADGIVGVARLEGHVVGADPLYDRAVVAADKHLGVHRFALDCPVGRLHAVLQAVVRERGERELLLDQILNAFFVLFHLEQLGSDVDAERFNGHLHLRGEVEVVVVVFGEVAAAVRVQLYRDPSFVIGGLVAFGNDLDRVDREPIGAAHIVDAVRAADQCIAEVEVVAVGGVMEVKRERILVLVLAPIRHFELVGLFAFLVCHDHFVEVGVALDDALNADVVIAKVDGRGDLARLFRCERQTVLVVFLHAVIDDELPLHGRRTVLDIDGKIAGSVVERTVRIDACFFEGCLQIGNIRTANFYILGFVPIDRERPFIDSRFLRRMMRIVRRCAVILLGEDLRKLTLAAPIGKRLGLVIIFNRDGSFSELYRDRDKIDIKIWIFYITLRSVIGIVLSVGLGVDIKSERSRRFIQPLGRDQPDKDRDAIGIALIDCRSPIFIHAATKSAGISKRYPCVFIPCRQGVGRLHVGSFHLRLIYRKILYFGAGPTDRSIELYLKRALEVGGTPHRIVTRYVVKFELHGVNIELANGKPLIVFGVDRCGVANIVRQYDFDSRIAVTAEIGDSRCPSKVKIRVLIHIDSFSFNFYRVCSAAPVDHPLYIVVYKVNTVSAQTAKRSIVCLCDHKDGIACPAVLRTSDGLGDVFIKRTFAAQRVVTFFLSYLKIELVDVYWSHRFGSLVRIILYVVEGRSVVVDLDSDRLLNTSGNCDRSSIGIKRIDREIGVRSARRRSGFFICECKASAGIHRLHAGCIACRIV